MIVQFLGIVFVIMGLLLFINYRDKDNRGDLYGSINFFICGSLTILTNNWFFFFIGFVNGWLLRIGGYDSGSSIVNFKVPDKVISLYSLFDKMVNSITKLSPSQLRDKFVEDGMMNIDLDDPFKTINYDERFTLSIKTDHREDCLVEILGKENVIIQLGVQVFYRKNYFIGPINLTEHSNLIDTIYEEYFGKFNSEIDNMVKSYQNDDIKGYTNVMNKEDKQSLIFRIGNKSYFPNEG